MTIILITGKAEAGKSTMTDYITRTWFNDFVDFALADDLKDLTFEILKVFNVKINSVDDLYDPITKVKYRKYLQQIGTECCRKVFGDDFWCQMLVKRIEKAIENGKVVIISDLRFKSEQEFFLDRFGGYDVKTVMVKNLVNENKLSSDEKKHQSESEFDKLEIDYVINNEMNEKFFYDIDEYVTKYIIGEEIDPNELKCNDEHVNDEQLDTNVDDDIDNTQLDLDIEPDAPIIGRATSISEKPIPTIINFDPNVLTPPIGSPKSPVDPSTHSSYTLGQIGEASVVEAINKVRPEFETTWVSATGHVADIHATDLKNKIKYIFEIKLKQNITKDDVTKFEFDVKRMQETEASSGYTIIGIFTSLNSDRIPSIGSLLVSRDKIYLTRKYFSENILELIFKLVETYSVALQPVSTLTNSTTVKYELPPNVLHLLAQLRTEYISLTREMELYNFIKSNTEANLVSVQELIGKLIIKQQFIKFINEEFHDILPIVNDNLISSDEDELRNYINSRKRKDIRKKDLLSKFPSMQTKIASMKLDDLINEYKSV